MAHDNFASVINKLLQVLILISLFVLIKIKFTKNYFIGEITICI